MEVLNLSVEFHVPDGNTLKRVVRVDNTTKVGDMARLLLDKFGRSEFDPSQFQLIIPTKSSNIQYTILSDLHKTLANYNIKNNDDLILKKRQKKSNPANAKLTSKKKPESIFKTLFSMSTLEMKLGDNDKVTPDITEVENQIEDLTILFKTFEYLNNYFNQHREVEEILLVFQNNNVNEQEVTELVKSILSNQSNSSYSDNIDIQQYQKNPKILGSFILSLLQVIFSQNSSYSLYTTYLKSTTSAITTATDTRSTYLYDIPIKNRIILKHIMLFLYNLSLRDSSLLETLSNIIGPFILGNVLLDPPPLSTSSPGLSSANNQQNNNITSSNSSNNLNNSLTNSIGGDESPDFSLNMISGVKRENSGSSLLNLNSSNPINIIGGSIASSSLPNHSSFTTSATTTTTTPSSLNNTTTNATTSTSTTSNHTRNQSVDTSSNGNNRILSQNENLLCKKVASDLIQNFPLYLLFSHLKISQLEGEKILFSSENIYCIDKCNFPPNKAYLGEIWVTNFRIIFINSNNNQQSTSIPNSTSSNSISSLASTQNISILSLMSQINSSHHNQSNNNSNINNNNSGNINNSGNNINNTSNNTSNNNNSSSNNSSTPSSSTSNTPIPTSPIQTSGSFSSNNLLTNVNNSSNNLINLSNNNNNNNNNSNSSNSLNHNNSMNNSMNSSMNSSMNNFNSMNNVNNSYYSGGNKLSTLDNTEIPLSMIYKWKSIKTGQLYDSFKIYCKDFRCKIIGFPTNSPYLSRFRDLLTKCSIPTLDTIFAYSSKENSFSNTECFPDNELLKEYNRIGVSWDHWRTTTISKVSENYPTLSIVPKSINDNIVVTSAYYRSFGFPVLAWSHPIQKSSITRAISPDDQNRNSSNYLLSPNSPNRNSFGTTNQQQQNINNNITQSNSNSQSNLQQPTTIENRTGSFSTANSLPNLPSATTTTSTNNIISHSGSTNNISLMHQASPVASPRIHQTISSSSIPQVCQEDIDFLKAILDIKSSNMLNVFDTGSNGSYSSTMIGCQIEFLALLPPSKVKERFNKLLHLHLYHPDSEWNETIRFSWLDSLKPIFSAAINIASNVDQGRSVLIQNSGGPDLELLLSSLSQLLLDPFYRTLDGFRVLIEKEWLSYGYPFSKRCHLKAIDDAFSPIFMQFVFIVWQIWKEFPSSFQFNEYYLLILLDNVYNNRFGTFLCNNYKERMENNVYSQTKSFWSFQSQNQERFTNSFYKFKNSTTPLPPVQHLRCQRVFQDTMWNEYFYRYCYKSSLAIEQFEDRIKSALLDVEMTVNNAISAPASILLPGLESLDLSNLRLYYLPSTYDSTLYHLTGLKQLNLSKNNLNSITCSLSSLINLERLSLEENQITNFPVETIVLLSEKLLQLKELNLSSNQLADLPNEFSLFKKLEKLSLNNNKFVTIPEVLNHLENLQELDLSELELPANTSLPTKLINLRVLLLNQTRISELPKDIGELVSLERLELEFNTLSTLPHSFRNLVKLEDLSLGFNTFVEVPREICFLVNLKRLIFEGNQLQFLPNEISQLSKLQLLNLRQNKLDTLPASIGQLSHLTSLNLHNNQLVALRPTMGLLVNLVELKLDGNRLKTPPPEIVSQGLKSILLYLKDLIKGQEQCYKMKLMIVGQENVGKTTLLKTLKDKKKKAAGGPNISTDGIAIDNWVFSSIFEEIDDNNRLVKKKQDITLSIWDFAGQEIYYTTHQFFLSERSVYIVAWNCALAEEESRVEFWLQSITTRAKDAPIIIVGTHLDDVNRTTAKMQKRRMKEKYMNRFSNIKAIKLVSCTSGKGISSLREKLEALVQSQSNMGESLPRSYMLLENLVKEETKKRIIPTIPWNEFIQMGTICTITDEAELLRATMFLHQLGSLVYFPKEPGLKQFVILDPQWITTMLSSIITTKHSYAKDGILMHKSLKQIWRPPQYPNHLHPHLISLLEKFEISYNLSNDNSSFETGMSLIPSLLLNDRPAIFPSLWGSFNPNIQQFGRVYQFEFVPNGFFSRLMVRILNFARVKAKCYWKNGMILQYDEETIFLEMNNAKKSLSFTVRGGVNSTTLSRDVIETIQSLLDDSFQLATFVYIPCFHCIFLSLPQIYYFPLEVCENAAVKGTAYLKCLTYDANVRTDLLVPDLVMSNFTGAKIPFDQLKIEEMIGEGGAALVYRARWQDQTVAVKKLKTVENLDSPIEINDISLSKAFNEFRRECWVMSELEHPNIVQLKGLCLDPLCIVTEYLPHGNLYSFLHKPQFEITWLFRLKVALDISSGMAFLHCSTPPIIHRDLKSPNILLASIDENAPTLAKVVDFGLSGLQHTITNRGVENPLWLAPEILNKTKEASTQTDVYAFGVILWELVTRKDYFGEIGFMTLVEEKVIAGERPEIPSDCPELYAKLIRDCWQNDASSRPKFTEIEDRLIKIAESMFPDLHFSSIYQIHSDPTSPQPFNNNNQQTSLKSLNLSSIDSNNNSNDNEMLSPSSSNLSMLNTPKENQSDISNHKRQLSNDSSSSCRNNKSTHDTISHSTSVASDLIDIDNTLTTPITPRTRSKTNEDTNLKLQLLQENDNHNQSSSTGNKPQTARYHHHNHHHNHYPIQHSQSQQSIDMGSLIDALPNLNSNVNSPNQNSSSTPGGKKVIYMSNNRRGSISIQPFHNEFNRELLPNQGTIQCLIKVSNNSVWAGTGNGFISTWKIEGPEKYIQRIFEANKDKKRIHCLYPYMNTVWCGSADDTITIWDSDTLSKIKTYPVQSPTCITRVGNTMWVGTIANTIHIYDLKKKTKYKGKISLDGPIECLLRRDQEVWVAVFGNIARVDINSLRVVQMIKAHDKAIHAMIEVDGQVWTSSSDASIKIWNSSCQLVQAIPNAHGSRIFTLELVGDFVWSGSWDTSIKIWSTKDYHMVSENSGKHKDAISSFVYIDNNSSGNSNSSSTPSSSTPSQQSLQQSQDNNNKSNIPRQVWSGSWDSSICVWTLNSFTSSTSSQSSNNNNNNSNNTSSISIHSSNGSVVNSPSFTSTLPSNPSSSSISSVNSNSTTISNNNQNNSSNNLSTIHETSPPLSSTPPQGSATIGPATRSQLARRTVSFVFDKFNKNKNNIEAIVVSAVVISLIVDAVVISATVDIVEAIVVSIVETTPVVVVVISIDPPVVNSDESVGNVTSDVVVKIGGVG